MNIKGTAGGIGSVMRSRSRMEINRSNTRLNTDKNIEDGDSYVDLLHMAVYSGESHFVKNIIEKKNVNPNSQDKEGNTPLHKAILFGYKDIASLLINEIKVNINIKNKNGLTPLHYAVLKKKLDIIRILVDNASIDANTRDKEGNTPLHQSIILGYKDIASFLIDTEKVNLNISNNYWLTPLHYTVLNNDIDTLRLLVYNPRINTNVKDKNGNTPLHNAAQINNSNIIYFLILQSKVDPNIKNTNLQTPLHIIAENSSLDIFQFCLKQKKIDTSIRDNNGKTPLDIIPEDSVIKVGPLIDIISKNGSISEFKDFKEKYNINLDAKSNVIRTVAFYAVQNNRLEIIEYLIKELHLEPTIKGSLGNSLLHQAIIYNKTYIGSKLIEIYNLDVDCKNNNGKTPLHFASEYGYFDAVVNLISAEADVNIQDNNGDTPPHLAAKNGFLNIVKFFIDLGNFEVTDKNDVDPNIKNNNLVTLLHLVVGLNNQDTVKYLVEKKEANTNAQDNDRNTPAHYAAQNRNLKMLNYLQQHGSNLNTKNNNDQTPMCILTKGCTFDSHEVLPHEKSQRLLNIDLINAAGEGNLSEVRNLIKKGADINYTSVWSVLHAAASSGNQRLVEYLIEEKKFNNIDLKDNFYGGTPLNVAARYGNLKIVKYLISKGANPNIKQNFSNQNTPAHEAATRNDLVMLNYLKNEGKADLNIKNRNGSTPVDLLSEENKVKFLNQVSHNRKRRDIVATTNALPSNIQNGFINLVQDNSTNSPMQIGYQEHNILVPEINSNVINGIIILGVLTAGLLNKTRHKQPVPEELLPPIEQSRKINNFDGGLQNLSEGIRKCGGDSLNRKRRDITEGQSVSWFSSIKDTVVNLVDSFVNLLVGDSKDTMTFQENSSTSNKLSLSTLSTKLTNETQSKQLKIDKDLLQLVDKSIQKNNASDIQHNLIGRIKNMNKKNNPRTNFDDVSVHGNITELQKNYVALT